MTAFVQALLIGWAMVGIVFLLLWLAAVIEEVICEEE